VLSNQAIPNRLSTMPDTVQPSRARGARQAAGGARQAAGASPPGLPEPRTAVPPKQAPGRERSSPVPSGRRVRLPSLGTIVFIGFLALTVARFMGQSLPFGGPTPRPTGAPGGAGPTASQPFAPGAVWFGTSLSGDCDLSEQASIFTGPVPVWWRAELSVVLGADDGVLVLTFRDDTEIDREQFPPDPAFSAWDILCGSHPITDDNAGAFKVEVWRADRSMRLATGMFLRR